MSFRVSREESGGVGILVEIGGSTHPNQTLRFSQGDISAEGKIEMGVRD